MTTGILKDVKIYEELRSRILGGLLRPGSRLVEDDICRQFEVTRTPVRQALRRLEQEGLLANEPYCGCRVREVSVEEVADLLDVREMLEGLAARNVALCGSESSFSKLVTLADMVDDAAHNDDWSRYFEADRQFHEAIVSLSGNRKLIEIMAISSFQLRSFTLYDRYLLDIISGIRMIEGPGKRRHLQIAETLASGDPDSAEQAIRGHIRSAKLLVEQAVRMASSVPNRVSAESAGKK